MNFLMLLHNQGMGAILADEMGLGVGPRPACLPASANALLVGSRSATEARPDVANQISIPSAVIGCYRLFTQRRSCIQMDSTEIAKPTV